MSQGVGGPDRVEGVEVGWDHIRALFSLDPAITYLNHGAFGVVPVPVQRAQARIREEMDANPMAFFTRGLVDRLAHTRRHAARFVGADPEHTALVPNVTAATQIVLRTLNIGPGDEVLLTDHGYGATALAVRRTGARLTEVAIPLEADADEVVALIAGAARAGTRLAIVDHITSPTARLWPAARIVEALHAKGIPVLVDGAHTPGMLPLDVGSIGADFWTGNLHKWALAARSTALLNVAPEYRDRVVPQATSWQEPNGFPAAVEFGGTLDYTAWLAAPTGLHVLRTLGVERVRRHNLQTVEYGQRVIAEALGTAPVIGPAAVSMRLVRLPAGEADDPAAAEHLRLRLAAELRCEVAVIFWGGATHLRICAAIYNRTEQYDRIAAQLPRLLRNRTAA